MKNVPAIVLAVMLAASLVGGVFMYRQKQAGHLAADEKIADFEKRLTTAAKELDAVKTASEKYRRESEKLREQLVATQAERQALAKDTTAQKTSAEEKIATLEKELRQSADRYAGLDQQMQAAATEVATLTEAGEKVQGEAEKLREQLVVLKQQKEALTTELAALKSRHDAEMAAGEKRMEARLAALQKEKEASAADAVALKSRYDAEVAACEKRLKAQLVTFQGEKDSSATEIEALKTQYEAGIAARDKELQAHSGRIADLDKDLSKSKAEAVDLRRDVAVCERKLSEMLGQKVRIRDEIDQMKSSYDALVSDLRQQIENKEVTIDRLEEKLSITFLDRILFGSGRTAITPQGQAVLKKVGETLKTVKGRKIQVVGHTDSLPIVPEYRHIIPSNWELSAVRAAAVIRFLQEDAGLETRNVELVGRSYYDPVADNETESGRARNRRVNIVLAPGTR